MRTKLWIVSLMAVSSALSALAADGDKLSKGDKNWLEREVFSIITVEEIEIFKDLQSKDRKLFKDLFWARRDPDALTPENEFQGEFERRIQAADSAIRSPGQRGSLTDMGEIYILLGGPSSTSRDDRDYQITTSPFDDESHLENLPKELAWSYPPNPSLRLPDGITFVFRVTDKSDARQRGVGYRLVGSEEVRVALERAKARFVVNRAINYNRDEEGRLLEPSHELYVSSRTKALLQQMLDSGMEEPGIPFETSIAYFQVDPGTIYVPVLVEIQADDLTWKNDAAEGMVFGAVRSSEGRTIYSFEQPLELARREDGIARFEMPIYVAPGEYTFYFGVVNDASEEIGTKAFPVDAPSFDDDVVLSSLLVYNETHRDDARPGTPGHAFQFGPTHMKVVTGDNLTFTTRESLGFFYFVYGYGLDPETGPELTEQYIFFKDGKRLTQTAVQPLQANTEHAFGNADIALSYFEPGSYKVQLRMIDKVKGKTLTMEYEFVLEGEGESN